jgi:hypothetical protein
LIREKYSTLRRVNKNLNKLKGEKYINGNYITTVLLLPCKKLSSKNAEIVGWIPELF